MDRQDLSRRFRLALSHREKARALTQEAGQALAAGALDKARHDSLLKFYTAQIELADAELDCLRRDQRAVLDRLNQQLQAHLKAQARLADRATAGSLDPQKANRLNRRHAAEIRQCREAIAACNRLLHAERAADVGGFVDQPLDRYTAALQRTAGGIGPPERATPYVLAPLQLT